jgi:hypothetical protein
MIKYGIVYLPWCNKEGLDPWCKSVGSTHLEYSSINAIYKELIRWSYYGADRYAVCERPETKQ